MTSKLYSVGMTKEKTPNTLESVQPCSGRYSLRKDMKLNAWLGVAVALYVIARLLAKWHPEWSAEIRAAIALAPLVPGLLYVRSWMRFIGGLDELQRRIQLEAWLFAVTGTVLIGIAISTLNTSGIQLGGLEHGLGMGGAFIVAFALWLVGSAIANCRYK
jgi:hypothetical protein